VSEAAAPVVRYVPGKRLGWLTLLALPLYATGDLGIAAGLLWNGALIAAALREARSLRAALPAVARKLDARLLVGTANAVRVKLHNTSPMSLRFALRDDPPDSFAVDREELEGELPPFARQELHYDVTPDRRGRFAFGALHLRLEGRLALGAAIATVPAEQACRVFPNLRAPRRYELAARLGQLHRVGVRPVREPGQGGEFEQLREYVSGDSYRSIDWKATAKRRRPVTRVHGREQSQQVVIALDAGYSMAARQDSLGKLDHAINAALMVSYVALRSGDKVGLIVFAQEVLIYVPPQRGHAQYRRILEALADVVASPAYVDFRRLTEFVRARLPRRALLVIFSDLQGEQQIKPLCDQAAVLRAKHLPLCVSVSDPVATTLAVAEVGSDEQAYRRVAAAALLEDREAAKAQLRKAGVGLVEAEASKLAVAAVNRYLAIKSRHAL
jgi:uncharacterized protein (DUF58 family)